MPRLCTPENAVRIRASAPTSVAVAEGLRHWIVAPVMRVQVPPVTPIVGAAVQGMFSTSDLGLRSTKFETGP